MPGSSPAGITTVWAVAQLEEHRVVIPAVAGSSPVRPPNHEHVAQWSKAAGCNPVIRWFKSSRALQYGKVAQTVERSVEARKAAGSMPALTTIPGDTQAVKRAVSKTARPGDRRVSSNLTPSANMEK